MAENQLVGLRADADVFATFEGDNTVLLQLVTKALLTDYKQVWGDLDRAAMVQATAKVISSTVLERTAANRLIERLVTAARRQPEALATGDEAGTPTCSRSGSGTRWRRSPGGRGRRPSTVSTV